MENKIPSYLLQTVYDQYELAKVKRAKLSFLDKTIINSATAVKSIYLQAENATKENFIQKINPHVKLISLIYLVVMISLVDNLVAQILTTAFIFLLYIIAKLKIFQVYRKIFFLAFIFGFLVVLPASLNVITPGKIIFNLITFNKPSHFWIYNIPQNIGFTLNGFQVVSLVFLRVLNSVSFSMLIVFTTSFPAFIKSFKILGVPDTFLMIISLAYKYIFILSRTIEETYFALKSRLSGNIKSKNIRKLISGRIFFIFKRSMIIYENTYYAMVSRGYLGTVILHSPKHFAFKDFVALVIIVALGIGIILL
ncbi:MAG: cobalt ECF transporter T component CbiQ [Bacteroidales bacterium]|nr:cobalt ECF transporter T component CbiQ [Bacteroidales bacterium]MDP3002661.1 cobalt ECF transporter T component CbiQ [Bacteroidales bacterium]